jgi:hypothetical protein
VVVQVVVHHPHQIQAAQVVEDSQAYQEVQEQQAQVDKVMQAVLLLMHLIILAVAAVELELWVEMQQGLLVAQAEQELHHL